LKETKKKILIHTCCAICSGYPIEYLKELGYEPIAYFYNPNIQPRSEYNKRLKAQMKLCAKMGCELIVEPYSPDIYKEVMNGYENHNEGSERCKRCFELRLLKTVQKAKAMDIENFTTTISVSPHKNYGVVKQVGDFFSTYFNINFLSHDFKKQDGFLKTNQISKNLEIYRQNYCGCDISMKSLKDLQK